MSRVARMPDFDASVFGSVRFFCDAKRPFGKGSGRPIKKCGQRAASASFFASRMASRVFCAAAAAASVKCSSFPA